MRIICRLFGCRFGCEPFCDRCGAYIYDWTFVQVGRLNWICRGYDWLNFMVIQAIIGRRCATCGRRFWRGGQYCCSTKCYDQWIPF